MAQTYQRNRTQGALTTLLMWLFLGAISTPSHVQAQEGQALGFAQGVVSGAIRTAGKQPRAEPDLVQAEAAIGMRLYEVGEDWRAISSLLRYGMLSTQEDAAYNSQLMVGQIYHRNRRHAWAARAFVAAGQAAPNSDAKMWARLLWLQQRCMGLDQWVACDLETKSLLPYAGTMPAPQSDLLHVQQVYLDVVFRRELSGVDAPIKSPRMKQAVANLRAYDATFDQLDLRSPWLAAGLSTVLPGAGQAYNGRWADALLALGLNAGLGVATYYSFTELDSVPLGVASALLWSGFYVGNVVNAYTDATRLNAKQYEAYFEGLKVLWPRVSVGLAQGQVQFGVAFDWPGFREPSTPQKAPLREEMMH